MSQPPQPPVGPSGPPAGGYPGPTGPPPGFPPVSGGPAGPPPGQPPPPPGWTPGRPPGPPPSSNKGLLIGLVGALVAILIAVFCLTAFVTPGFLTSDDSSQADDNGGSGDSGDDESGARDVLEAVAAGFDDQDQSALEDLACADATANVSGSASGAGDIDSATLGDITDESDEEVTADLELSVSDTDVTFALVVSNGDDGWCWQDLEVGLAPGGTALPDPSASATDPSETPSTEGGGAAVDEGAKVVEEFIGDVNNADVGAAEDLLCDTVADSGTDLQKTIDQRADLSVEIDRQLSNDSIIFGDVTGTVAGDQVTGSIGAIDVGQGWCVTGLYVF